MNSRGEILNEINQINASLARTESILNRVSNSPDSFNIELILEDKTCLDRDSRFFRIKTTFNELAESVIRSDISSKKKRLMKLHNRSISRPKIEDDPQSGTKTEEGKQ